MNYKRMDAIFARKSSDHEVSHRNEAASRIPWIAIDKAD
jgi:hypothetical protein